MLQRFEAANAALTLIAISLVAVPVLTQAQDENSFPAYTPPRTEHGTPDLQGIWQSFTTANWNIVSHSVEPGPFPEIMGAWGALRASFGIVEGDEIPYQEWALEERQQNFDNRTVVNVTNDPRRFDTGDPELQCFRAGIPRANYMPFPFQIFQTPEQILTVYEYKGAYRTIYMDYERPRLDASWMGTSNGEWDGDTLVVDVAGFNNHLWLDRAGNFASDSLHVVERWTRVSPYHMRYEATIEDPTVFTRPWDISFMLYRHVEENAELKEFQCIPIVEPMMYKPLGFYEEDVSND
jgi:hypothetical protein